MYPRLILILLLKLLSIPVADLEMCVRGRLESIYLYTEAFKTEYSGDSEYNLHLDINYNHIYVWHMECELEGTQEDGRFLDVVLDLQI